MSDACPLTADKDGNWVGKDAVSAIAKRLDDGQQEAAGKMLSECLDEVKAENNTDEVQTKGTRSDAMAAYEQRFVALQTNRTAFLADVDKATTTAGLCKLELTNEGHWTKEVDIKCKPKS